MAAETKYENARLLAYIRGLAPAADALASTLARDVVTQAKSHAPVRTGALRDSITGTRRRAAAWEVSVGVHYGLFVELGHMTRGGTHVAARPFFIPAVREVAQTVPAKAKAAFAP